MHFINITETIVTHFKHFQIYKASQVQYSEGSIIAAIIVNNDGFYSRIQCIQLFDRMNSGIRVGDEWGKSRQHSSIYSLLRFLWNTVDVHFISVLEYT